jgi:hypothetical protein
MGKRSGLSAIEVVVLISVLLGVILLAHLLRGPT